MAFGDPKRIIWNIPGDAQVVGKVEEWEIHHSPSQQSLYIYPTEYHAAALRLDANDLQRLLRQLQPGADAGLENQGGEQPDAGGQTLGGFTH